MNANTFPPISRRPISRRGVMKLTAAAGLAGTVSLYPGRRSFASADKELQLTVEAKRIVVDGVESDAIAIGDSVPAPTLRWREGDEVVVQVTNRLSEPTSIHWHGLLIQGVMDGAPGFNGYEAIGPGETYTYRFRLRQAGTYWYHSHSGLQEQQGMYGAIVIEPAGREPVRYDRDYVVVLSDHTQQNPMTVLRNLKSQEGYYNYGKRTLIDFFRQAERDGFNAALQDRLEWGDMRMDPTDLADVTGYAFLVNGRGPEDNWTGLFEPGERIRLRFINASAMSFFDVRIPDLPMTVIAADGQFVVPVQAHEFRFGVGETYDVIVRPQEDRAFTIMAEPIDRSGYARATLAPRPGMEAEIPPLRPRAILAMSDMNHGAMGMDHGTMGHGAMNHGPSGGGHAGHASMSHGTMNHAMPMQGSSGHGAHGTPAGHAMAAPVPADGAPPVGWDQVGTLPGEKALAYADLKAFARNADNREPGQEILVRLTGIMERYIWTLNGRKFEQGEPIRVAHGERVRIRYVNETMMAHPMHLHGMFVELENGESERRPLKHVVIVPPGKEVSVLLTADEPGDWPFHCHLMYHMASGMMTRFIVEQPTAKAGGKDRA
ncbi:MAG: copper resistance system multicopper oxidase [Alphaproteobacteria bacterium]|nr:copper resistance system multicopper oxidase [Alphaproteobacteria bacterium]MBU0886496.1 copper resistance system multicopper oxidase [Alphaproteobacteria bacterium]MBU1814084.1 copper resistance system multicopper oxidase [Alphaproteobacteria bacterium]MBU2090441.1 copper resistance system multicopper oxidase [Alphaproteobacteria bacterium]